MTDRPIPGDPATRDTWGETLNQYLAEQLDAGGVVDLALQQRVTLSTSQTVSGAKDFSGQSTFAELAERTNAVTATTATTTLNCDLAMTHIVTQQANTTLAFSGLDATAGRVQSVTVILIQDATGGRTVTWPAGTKWPNGVAPTLTTTANAINIVTLMTTNAGTNWYGFLAGAGMA
jgi:hypothetical protein